MDRNERDTLTPHQRRLLLTLYRDSDTLAITDPGWHNTVRSLVKRGLVTWDMDLTSDGKILAATL